MLMTCDHISEHEMHRAHLARIYREGQYDQAQISAFFGMILHRIGTRLVSWGMHLQVGATPATSMNT